MNVVCNTCLFNDFPISLKQKMNVVLGRNFFGGCPIPDNDKIACMRKYIALDSNLLNSLSVLKESNLITEEEQIIINGKFRL